MKTLRLNGLSEEIEKAMEFSTNDFKDFFTMWELEQQKKEILEEYKTKAKIIDGVKSGKLKIAIQLKINF